MCYFLGHLHGLNNSLTINANHLDFPVKNMRPPTTNMSTNPQPYPFQVNPSKNSESYYCSTSNSVAGSGASVSPQSLVCGNSHKSKFPLYKSSKNVSKCLSRGMGPTT